MDTRAGTVRGIVVVFASPSPEDNTDRSRLIADCTMIILSCVCSATLHSIAAYPCVIHPDPIGHLLRAILFHSFRHISGISSQTLLRLRCRRALPGAIRNSQTPAAARGLRTRQTGYNHEFMTADVSEKLLKLVVWIPSAEVHRTTWPGCVVATRRHCKDHPSKSTLYMVLHSHG